MSASRKWRSQRLTAIALIPLVPWLLLGLATLPDTGYETVRHWLAQPTTGLPLALLLLIGGHHAFLGVEVILEDYVADPPRGPILLLLRSILLIVVTIGLVALLSIYRGV